MPLVLLDTLLTRWDTRPDDPLCLGTYCLGAMRGDIASGGGLTPKPWAMWHGPSTSRFRLTVLSVAAPEPIPQIDFEVYSADDNRSWPLVIAQGSWTPTVQGETRTILHVSGVLTPIWAVAFSSATGPVTLTVRVTVDRLGGGALSVVPGSDVTLVEP